MVLVSNEELRSSFKNVLRMSSKDSESLLVRQLKKEDINWRRVISIMWSI